MELLSLEQIQQSSAGYIRLELLIPWLRSVLQELSRFHSSRTPFEDLHPHNILVSATGQVELRHTDCSRSSYFSPEVLFKLEQNQSQNVFTCENDMWAFGSILFNLALGFPPVSGSTFDTLLADIFERYGNPTRSDFRSISDYRFNNLPFCQPNSKNTTRQLFLKQDGIVSPTSKNGILSPIPLFLVPHFCEAVRALLKYHPQQRATAEECLELPLFRIEEWGTQSSIRAQPVTSTPKSSRAANPQTLHSVHTAKQTPSKTSHVLTPTTVRSHRSTNITAIDTPRTQHRSPIQPKTPGSAGLREYHSIRQTPDTTQRTPLNQEGSIPRKSTTEVRRNRELGDVIEEEGARTERTFGGTTISGGTQTAIVIRKSKNGETEFILPPDVTHIRHRRHRHSRHSPGNGTETTITLSPSRPQQTSRGDSTVFSRIIEEEHARDVSTTQTPSKHKNPLLYDNDRPKEEQRGTRGSIIQDAEVHTPLVSSRRQSTRPPHSQIHTPTTIRSREIEQEEERIQREEREEEDKRERRERRREGESIPRLPRTVQPHRLTSQRGSAEGRRGGEGGREEWRGEKEEEAEKTAQDIHSIHRLPTPAHHSSLPPQTPTSARTHHTQTSHHTRSWQREEEDGVREESEERRARDEAELSPNEQRHTLREWSEEDGAVRVTEEVVEWGGEEGRGRTRRTTTVRRRQDGKGEGREVGKEEREDAERDWTRWEDDRRPEPARHSRPHSPRSLSQCSTESFYIQNSTPRPTQPTLRSVHSQRLDGGQEERSRPTRVDEKQWRPSEDDWGRKGRGEWDGGEGRDEIGRRSEPHRRGSEVGKRGHTSPERSPSQRNPSKTDPLSRIEPSLFDVGR
ncbi:hypothetical protein BLNAU_21996 [Blattamonas nauphoetae]|uniref:Protein kinase domain-containing protein n=1 Tax=Blattamonas nauphoetae TaxID=2049346 RepID=A0ABQ9WUC2_9EUKA|nr:hypothetical protein BLNAU_21996 [Blattamonas nauphoetae]